MVISNKNRYDIIIFFYEMVSNKVLLCIRYRFVAAIKIRRKRILADVRYQHTRFLQTDEKYGPIFASIHLSEEAR